MLRLRSDEQLVALVRSGHEEAFQAIHDRYRQRLFAYMRQMLPLRQDAEDALQEVFERAYASLLNGDRELALRPWLYRIAHNRCIDHLRRPAPPPPEAMLQIGASPRDPVTEADCREALRRLLADVQRLPSQQRSALLMRELGGISYADVADALGVTVPAVKSLLVRARVSLAAAGEARETACDEIRAELVTAHEGRVRPNSMARRHLRDCAGCREFRGRLRGRRRSLLGVVPTFGPFGVLARLLGGGSTGGAAGSGAAAACGGASSVASTGGLLASAGAVVSGAGHVATLLAATVVTAGGAAALGHSSALAPHHAHPRPAAVAHHAATPAAGVPPATAAPASASTETSAPTPPAAASAPPVTSRLAPAVAAHARHGRFSRRSANDSSLGPIPDPSVAPISNTAGASSGTTTGSATGPQPGDSASGASATSTPSGSDASGATTDPNSGAASSSGTSTPNSTATASQPATSSSTAPSMTSTPQTGSSTAPPAMVASAPTHTGQAS